MGQKIARSIKISPHMCNSGCFYKSRAITRTGIGEERGGLRKEGRKEREEEEEGKVKAKVKRHGITKDRYGV